MKFNYERAVVMCNRCAMKRQVRWYLRILQACIYQCQSHSPHSYPFFYLR